jgi:hypothetical protein
MKQCKTIALSLMLVAQMIMPIQELQAEEISTTESVCNGLQNATPGLYGLCVAYCEAQSVPTDFSGDSSTWFSRPRSKNILKNYEKKMRAGDPAMPCLNQESACPAFSQEDLNEVGNLFAGSTLTKRDSDELVNLTESFIECFQQKTHRVYVNKNSDGTYFGQLEITHYQEGSEPVMIVKGSSDLTEEEAMICSDMIKAHPLWESATNAGGGGGGTDPCAGTF